MHKHRSIVRWLLAQPSYFLVAVALWLIAETIASALLQQFPTVPSGFAYSGIAAAQEPTDSTTSSDESANPPSDMTEPQLQLDPLNSPYPVPWNWVMANLADSASLDNPVLRYYRSPSLISPDGEYAAYSRIQMQVQPNFVQSRVGSVLFLENLRTGDLQTITAASPFADNPFMSTRDVNQAGTIAILIPVAWSETSDRVLAREFESLFGTGLASDYAVIWDREINRAQTIAPTQVQYSNAVLLGWSQSSPDQVLFRAGNLGQEEWPIWAVDVSGETAIATQEDQPITFGRTVSNIWSGPQAYHQ